MTKVRNWYGKPIVLPPVCISKKLKEFYLIISYSYFRDHIGVILSIIRNCVSYFHFLRYILCAHFSGLGFASVIC